MTTHKDGCKRKRSDNLTNKKIAEKWAKEVPSHFGGASDDEISPCILSAITEATDQYDSLLKRAVVLLGHKPATIADAVEQDGEQRAFFDDLKRFHGLEVTEGGAG